VDTTEVYLLSMPHINLTKNYDIWPLLDGKNRLYVLYFNLLSQIQPLL
jgi:hypothetical protein